jgi:3'-phosphoadenosine 5'-phosphosulfate sulfotransferase (PAPS reductase)/FAD synthetase
MPATYHPTHLRTLEAEVVHSMREVAVAAGMEPLQWAHSPGEHAAVFPSSNWTELDVWQCAMEDRKRQGYF